MCAMTRRQFVEGAGYVAGALSVSGLPSVESPTELFAADLPKAGDADWGRYGSDIRNTRFNPKEKTIGKSNVDRLKERWKFQVDVPIATTPTVIGDTLFF